jgi:hypothetical protein
MKDLKYLNGIILIIATVLAVIFTYILNSSLISDLLNNTINIDENNYESELIKIKDDQVIKIKGSPNLISRVEERNENGEVVMRYFGLKNYDYRIIVASKNIEDLDLNEFTGKITRLSTVQNYSNLLGELNKPLTELIQPYLINPTAQTTEAITTRTSSNYQSDSFVIWSGDRNSKVNLIIFFKLGTFLLTSFALVYIFLKLIIGKAGSGENIVQNS